jgi:hypothetical protein
MGRPLKIQKYSLGSGDAGSSTVNGNGIPVPIDQAYPPFSELVDPSLPVGATNPTPWLGVVGGLPNAGTSTTYPVVSVTVNIELPNGTNTGAVAGAIIRQKGARKYMVADLTPIVATSFVVGATYKIVSLGTTYWHLIGAAPTYAVGDVFTCTSVGTGTGTAYVIGTCVLDDSATPAPGNMSIGFVVNGGAVEYISKLTNKYLFDFTGGETGGNSNTGDVWDWEQVQENIRYDANFFADDGYEIKSGTSGQANTATQQNQLTLGLVNNIT